MVILQRYAAKIGSLLDSYPPFDMDGDGGAGIKSKHGINFTLSGTNSTMTDSYTIQVQHTQRPGSAYYETMKTYCADLTEDGTGWRLPTQIELFCHVG